MMKNGGGQWDWVGLKTSADLTGYTKMVAEITGPAGAKFTFKVNDKVEVAADGTGELVQVEWTAPADFTWDAAKQTMIMFPDFAAPGVGNEFTITKLELQGEGKTAIDLLAANITLSNEYVQACRDLVLTKPTTNTNEWDCVIISLAGDYAKYQGVQYTVKGTAGEKLLVKVNDQFESWVTLDGKAQTGLAPLSGEFNASKAAVVLFPNGETAGSGNPIIISQLVFVPPLTEHAGTAADPYTVEDALKLGATLAESGYGKNGEVVEMWVKGFVVDQGRDVGTSSNNIKLASTANGQTTLLIFKVDETADIKDVRLGDEVVIKGFLMNWSGTIEVSSSKVDGADVNPVFVSCTRGTNAITVASDSSDKATVTDLSAQSGLNGSTFTFKVEVTSGFQISAVKVNGETVEAADGVYSGIVSGPTSISVETVEAGEAVPQEATLEYKDSTTTTNMGEGNNAAIVNLDANLFTVTADKGSNNNFPGLNKALDVRVYKGNSMTIAIASGYTIKSIKINFLNNYAANAVIEVNGVAVTGEAGVYAINASSFVLKHSEASNDQVRFSSIVITYVEGDAPQPTTVKHIFNASELTIGDITEDAVVAEYFKLHATSGKKLTVDANNKSIDGLTLTQRLKFGGASGAFGTERYIEFTAAENAKIKVYAISSSSGDSTRRLALFNENGVMLQAHAVDGAAIACYTYEVVAGKYFFGCPDNAVNVYYIEVEEGVELSATATLVGARVTGADNAKLVLNAETGLYEGTFAIARQWGRAFFAEVYSDGTTVALTYNNATFSGDGILDAKAAGSPNNCQLYADSDEMVAAGEFCYGLATKCSYKATYNPTTKAVVVTVVEPDSELSGVRVAGDATADLTLNAETGVYEGQFTLSAIWKNVHFEKVFADGTVFTLKYANTTFAGDGIRPALQSATWTEVLYAETDNGSFFLSKAAEATYDVAYNPQTKTLTVNIHVEDPYANVDLLADLPASGSDYKSANWKVEKYTDKWTELTDTQMRSRTSNAGVRVANMSNGYGMTMRFTFSTGQSLGIANTLSLKVGNYWSNAENMSVKIKVVDVNGNETFILGDANNWVTIPKTEDVVPQTITFSDTEVKAVVFITKSSVNGGTFLYIGDVHLTYEEPAPSPSANN